MHQLNQSWLDTLFIGVTYTAGLWIIVPLLATAVTQLLNVIYCAICALILATYRRWREILWGLLTVTVVSISIASLGGFLNIPVSSIRFWRWAAWATELSSNFHLQYLLILALLSVVFWVTRRPKRALLAGIFVLLNLTLLLPLYATSRPAAASQTYRILMLNAGQLSNAGTSVFDLINVEQPDIIVLLEVGLETPTTFRSLQNTYPYTTYRPGRESYDGSLLYSKYPFVVENEGHNIDHTESPLVTQIKLGSHKLTLIGIQTRAPLRPGRTINRRIQIEQLGQFIAQQSGPILLVGDFNTTRWSPILNDFFHQSGLRDARNGFGVQASWPTFLPYLLAVPIDQVLVSSDIAIHNFTKGPNVGSDHYPILINFSLRSEIAATQSWNGG